VISLNENNGFLSKFSGSLLLIGLLAFLIPLLIPLPGWVIDFCIVFSFGMSIVIYLQSSMIKEWDQFKTFPTLLLLMSVFRISLNVSTTKKILLDGEAGGIIEQFGNLVIGSNPGLGFVIFIIILVVQFIIANGAGRLSEVSARFTLDALPGKQMSIDADLNSGAISQEEAKEKRKKLDMQIDFFGHMDGAGKFIKGDVWLGVIIIFINIVGGLIRGMMFMGMAFTDALHHFTMLTIGDGIVNQICSFLITVGSAVIMTRVYDGKDKAITGSILDELTHNPMVSYVVGGLFATFAVFGMFTALPVLPFLLMSVAMFYVGYRKTQEKAREKANENQRMIEQIEEEKKKEKTEVKRMIEVDPITLEVGFALIPVVNTEKEGENIQDKITLMRKNIARELGMKVPKIRVIDNSALMPYTKYNIKVKESVVASGEIKLNSLLAFKTPYVMREVEGIPTLDPIFKEEAIWIDEGKMNEAKELGYQVLDPLSILSTHLNEMIKRHLYELLELQEVYELVQEMGEKRKVLYDELYKKDQEIDLTIVKGVLQNLLRENISIRDLPTIVEGIVTGCKIFGVRGDITKVDDITMIVRERISKHLCEKNTNFDGKMHVLLLEEQMESAGETYLRHDGYYMKINYLQEVAFINSLRKQVQRAMMADLNLVLLTSRNDLRCSLAKMVHKHGIPISVMLQSELVQGVMVESFGQLQTEQEAG